ncbi:MAG: hypothetical protein SFU98_13510 [Leptospiraceae bacterium]|nr:hypothetical protein [Leptospiraceae bacterium]
MSAKFIHRSIFNTKIEKLFEFHEDKNGFDTLVGLDPNVKVIQRPENIQVGAKAILEVTLAPFVKKIWVAMHTGYEKNSFFEDSQESGPFLFFQHKHKFFSHEKGAILSDEIEFDFFALPISKYFIVQKLKQQFKARHIATAKYLETSFETIYSGLE